MIHANIGKPNSGELLPWEFIVIFPFKVNSEIPIFIHKNLQQFIPKNVENSEEFSLKHISKFFNIVLSSSIKLIHQNDRSMI